MTKRKVTKDGIPLKVLQYLSTDDGKTSKALKLVLTDVDNDSMDRTLTTLKRKNFVSQKKKGFPYFLTPLGAKVLGSFDIQSAPTQYLNLAHEAAALAKKPGAPKGKITNGVVKFSRPGSMSAATFNELVDEHQTAERRAEAIENLFQHWPR